MTITCFVEHCTEEQQQALLEVYNRDTKVAPSFATFVQHTKWSRDYILVWWKGMALGIEHDGYTHS